jgi:hypothetical protein
MDGVTENYENTINYLKYGFLLYKHKNEPVRGGEFGVCILVNYYLALFALDSNHDLTTHNV